MANTQSNLMYHYIISGVLILAAAGGGYVYGKDHTTNTSTTSSTRALGYQGGGGYGGGTSGGAGGYGGGFGGRGGAGGAAAGGGLVSGQVTAVNGNTVTVQDANGNSSTIDISGATITKTVTGSASDVTVGETILGRGTENSDGSVSATTIQIRPASSTTTNTNPDGSI